MAEIPEKEFVDHPDEILRRVKAGEEITLTTDGEPIADVTPRRRAVSLEEFLSWPKANRSLLDDIKKLRGNETTETMRDPWERYA